MLIFKEWNPLMYAAAYGHLDIVKLLLNQGANVNSRANDGKFLILYFIVQRQSVL